MAREWRYLVPAPVRHFPADLAATVGLTLLTVAVVTLPGVRETPLRVVLGLPFVLFLPGYAFIALLFPEAGPGPAEDDATSGAGVADQGTAEAGATAATEQGNDEGEGGVTARLQDRGIDGIERVALSFGLSIAIVPLIGLGLNFTPWGIRLAPILVSVSVFTIACAVGAAYRRWELPPAERFRVPYRAWLARGRAELLKPETRTDAALNVLLVASLLLAVGSVGYAIAVPSQGEQFTEFYLLTETEDGELIADDYPQNLTVGEPADLVVGVSNHEHERVQYTVVVELQRVETANNQTEVLDRDELDRFETTLAHNETWEHPHTVTPTMAGETLRLQYLLYRGSAPADPSAETAYRELHLWVTVSES